LIDFQAKNCVAPRSIAHEKQGLIRDCDSIRTRRTWHLEHAFRRIEVAADAVD